MMAPVLMNMQWGKYWRWLRLPWMQVSDVKMLLVAAAGYWLVGR
jgi:hypothetical protein